METENRQSPAALSGRLLEEAYRFNFFQAVRLLERVARERGPAEAAARRFPVGGDRLPQQEIVHFRALVGQAFPGSGVHRIEQAGGPAQLYAAESPPPEMTVTFLGLTGPSGVLPHHYTTELLQAQHDKDSAMSEFFDLFNHRTVSLFYRAWEKYRFPIDYERRRLDREPGDDLFTRCLYSLVGFGTPGLRRRLAIDDEALLYYSGHFAHYPRSAAALRGVLADYFQLAVELRQFQGQWLRLSPAEQSRLPDAERPDGLNCRLGEDVIVGERVWDVQSLFRIRLGPLDYQRFSAFLPPGDAYRPLCDVVRSYLGLELDFEVQLLLLAAEVPWCQLGGEASRLGWNTWLRSGAFDHDADDAVFRIEPVIPGDLAA